jgi:hypothetical protein
MLMAVLRRTLGIRVGYPNLLPVVFMRTCLFDWYRDGFADSREALMEYLARHRPDLAESLAGYPGRSDHHYDWALNDAP